MAILLFLEAQQLYLLLIFRLAKYTLAQSKGDDNTKDMSELLNPDEEGDFQQPHWGQRQLRRQSHLH